MVAIFAPLWLPPVWLISLLRDRTRKKGLVLALGLGPVGFLAAVVAAVYLLRAGQPLWSVIYATMFGVVQAVLVVSAARQFSAEPREDADRRLLIWGIGSGVLYALVFLILFWASLRTRSAPQAAYQKTVVTVLGTFRESPESNQTRNFGRQEDLWLSTEERF